MIGLRQLMNWNELSMSLFSVEGGPIGFLGSMGFFVLVVAMAGGTVVTFSDMAGNGPTTYSGLVDYQTLAWPLLGAATMGGLVLYGASPSYWSARTLVTLGVLSTYLGAAGVLFLTAAYPELALLVVALHHPVILVGLRMATAGRISPHSFYVAVCVCCTTVALLTLSAWIAWDDGRPSSDSGIGMDSMSRQNVKERLASDFGLYGLQSWQQCLGERAMALAERDWQVLGACARLELCGFLIWSCPLLESGLLLSIAIFVALRAWCIHKVASALDKEDDRWTVQRVVFSFFLLMVIFWVGAALGGTNMRLSYTLLRLLAVLFVIFCIWVVHAVPLQSNLRRTARSLLWRVLAPARASDWTKAAIVCFGGLPLLVFFTIDVTVGLGKRILCLQKGILTERGSQVVKALSSWHWPNVMLKTALSAFLMTFAFAVTPKSCVIFLAWLVREISGFDLWLVSVVYFLVGLAMFTLPPMPGLAVYMASGTILSAHCRELGWGFGWSLVYASAMSFLIKIASVVMQYKLFGQLLARAHIVQRLVGLHKESTLALHRVLVAEGLHLDKAAILCCGPDWPTAVLCGVLGVGLRTTVLGNLPVALIVVPYTFAGACWLDDNLMEISGLTVLVMCILQNCSFAAAVLFTAADANHYREDVKKSHWEHGTLHDEALHSLQQQKHYKFHTTWEKLSCSQRGCLILASIVQFLAFWAYALLTPLVFRDFSLAHEISDSLEDGGLGGNPFNILLPLGNAVVVALVGGLGLVGLFMLETAVRIRALGEDGKLQKIAQPPRLKRAALSWNPAAIFPFLASKSSTISADESPGSPASPDRPGGDGGVVPGSLIIEGTGSLDVLEALQLGGDDTPVVMVI